MKTKYYLLLIILSFWGNFLLAQHENDTWMFGNNKWTFNTSSTNGFIHTTNFSPNIRYTSSVISDKNTGELLFYSDGYKIYNKNGMLMMNGDNLFGVTNNTFDTFGNPSDQSSIIVPLPNSDSIYYVFYINGNRQINDQGSLSDPTSYNYGLRYAIVNMSLDGGLGAVTSKNNILFSNSPTNALTSTIGSNGSTYWIITANNGNFLSYNLTPGGLNTTPVVSPAPYYGNFFKISPDSKKMLTRINTDPNKGIYLSDFDNATGSITNQINIVPLYGSQYIDRSDFPNSAEFSADSNIIYFTSSDKCLCEYPASTSDIWSYRISTSSFYSMQHMTPAGLNATMQRAQNGKIYLIAGYQELYTSSPLITKAIFGWTTTGTNNYNSYSWSVINNPNNPNFSLNQIYPQIINTRNGYSFPQLVQHLDYINTCPDNLDIITPITSSQDFQAGQHITASSSINDFLIVNYKAGQDITLLPGFYVKGTRASLFHAYINPCDGLTEILTRSSMSSKGYYSKEIKTSLISDVKVYPNPTSNYININSGNEKIISWELFDISGRSILKGNNTPIDAQNIIKGSYLLKINLEKRQISKTIIIK